MPSQLENLLKLNSGLKAEPPAQSEINGLIRAARKKLGDLEQAVDALGPLQP